MFGRTFRSYSVPLVGWTQIPFRNVTKARVESLVRYAAVQQTLELPLNVDPNEATRFSPNRSREVNASSLLVHNVNITKFASVDGLIDVTSIESIGTDPHISSYDCNNSVSLNSTMQSNVSILNLSN